ncbi:MAG TPA: GDP-mannose 4,6-dehydratase, partial [Bacteroidota bacterium]|nr:GDP-mannose 4,6-dehydratase [Bacteroidota bacterium]
DFVIGSSELHSIKELLQIAFRLVDLNWQDYVVLDSGLLRNIEYVNLCADSRKAREKLGWRPKVHFNELVELMVRNDLELVKMK